jgi:surface antigen
MRLRSPRCLSAALAACLMLSASGQAQVIPFGGNGPGLSPEDNQMLVESIARLNAAEPSRVGLSESWNNPQTRTSGTSTILRVFHSRGMVCHLVRHQIVAAGRARPRDYRLTWCRTPTGEWKIKA